MKITICGSVAFYQKMQQIKNKLESNGYQVKLPPSYVSNGQGQKIPVKQYYQIRKTAVNAYGFNNQSWIWNEKEKAIRRHFDKVAWADAILVLNYKKNNIKGYIGANTLMEMGLAMYLKKKIYLLNPIPEVSSKEEILGMKPTIIYRNLNKID